LPYPTPGDSGQRSIPSGIAANTFRGTASSAVNPEIAPAQLYVFERYSRRRNRRWIYWGYDGGFCLVPDCARKLNRWQVRYRKIWNAHRGECFRFLLYSSPPSLFLIAVVRADGTVHIERASTGLCSISLK